MEKDNLVCLGACTKPHGIRGGFSFNLENTVDSVLANKMVIKIYPKSNASSVNVDGEDVTISKISFGNKTIAYLNDIDDRNVVEAMLPFDIYVSRDVFPELDDDEFYIADLIGLDAYEFGTENKVGVVKKYYDNTAQIVLTIRGNGKSFDILLIDQFVPEIDVENGRIYIKKPHEI